MEKDEIKPENPEGGDKTVRDSVNEKIEPALETAHRRQVQRVMADTQSKSILNITNLVTLSILIALILFIVKIASVFGIFLFSFLVAFLLYPMVDWFTVRRVPRVWSILIVYIIIWILLLGIGAAFIPAVIAQANSLIEQLPEFSERWEQDWAPMFITVQDFLAEQGVSAQDIQEYVSSIIPTIQAWGVKIGQAFASGVQGAVSWIVFLVTVPIIVFYLLLDAPRIHQSLFSFAPKRTSTEIQKLLNRLAKMLNHYLRGQLKLSFLMFVITTIALMLFGVKHALLLGFLAGITEIIPIVGPILALIPALLISYFTSSDHGLLIYIDVGWGRALIIFAFYMLLQYVEGNILVPRIMGKDLNLHPLTVMFSILAGGYLAGLIGMLLSLPIAASLKVVFETYYPSFIERVEDLMSRRPNPHAPTQE